MIVDLRSDTFTKPTPAMRKAMASAEVGDDIFNEDPTINRLQDETAAMLGKEAGLFVPSGHMGNQAAIYAHTQRGQEVIVDENAHLFYYESGAPALLSGVQLRTLPGRGGIMSAAQIEAAIRPDNIHFPPTSLICIENTLNRGGGRIYPLAEIKAIRTLADSHGVKMHLDGARLWNAAVASGIPLAEWAAPFDSVSLCFSKGLGAPVGSIIVGDHVFIEKAHRARKIFGGGMRQSGIIGAGALYAIRHHMDRLSEDHVRARRLAEAVDKIDGISVDMNSVETNIIIMSVTRDDMSAEDMSLQLEKRGVLMFALGPKMLRAVTHLDVDDEGIDKAIAVFREI
ncbi:aminotransferase class I/II-fold pyridoxal phosphate-dependent enzyme [bacterium]|nr:aminotransferase class I/II-fold pyridoxal phosphate-dependent enzyme [bacterium]